MPAAIIVDSYSESNIDNGNAQGSPSGYDGKEAQSFTGVDGYLSMVKVFIGKLNSPTGNMTAVLYAETHSSGFGIDSKPTGAALATSDPIDASACPSGFPSPTTTPTIFTFSGVNKYKLVAGTKYCISIEFVGGDGTNDITVGTDGSSPTHAGNWARWLNADGAWSIPANWDMAFYVYVDYPPPGSLLQMFQ